MHDRAAANSRITLPDRSRSPPSAKQRHGGFQGASKFGVFWRPGCFQIFVKNLDGKIITVNVAQGDTMHHVKAKIAYQEGIKPDTLKCLPLCMPHTPDGKPGEQLEDCRTLGSYGIQRQSTLHGLFRADKDADELVKAYYKARPKARCHVCLRI